MESDPPDRAKAGSSLRHWPPGTNSKTFVPSFFAIQPVLKQEAQSISQNPHSKPSYRFLYIPV
jgi:hypothetical protein